MDIKQHSRSIKHQSSGAVWKRRWTCARVPNSPCGLDRRKATLKKYKASAKFRSYVTDDVDLGSRQNRLKSDLGHAHVFVLWYSEILRQLLSFKSEAASKIVCLFVLIAIRHQMLNRRDQTGGENSSDVIFPTYFHLRGYITRKTDRTNWWKLHALLVVSDTTCPCCGVKFQEGHQHVRDMINRREGENSSMLF